jgi:hypothetical protein
VDRSAGVDCILSNVNQVIDDWRLTIDPLAQAVLTESRNS